MNRSTDFNQRPEPRRPPFHLDLDFIRVHRPQRSIRIRGRKILIGRTVEHASCNRRPHERRCWKVASPGAAAVLARNRHHHFIHLRAPAPTLQRFPEADRCRSAPCCNSAASGGQHPDQLRRNRTRIHRLCLADRHERQARPDFPHARSESLRPAIASVNPREPPASKSARQSPARRGRNQSKASASGCGERQPEGRRQAGFAFTRWSALVTSTALAECPPICNSTRIWCAYPHRIRGPLTSFISGGNTGSTPSSVAPAARIEIARGCFIRIPVPPVQESQKHQQSDRQATAAKRANQRILRLVILFRQESGFCPS